KHWQIKKLGEVFNIYRGGSPRPIKDFLTDDKDGINWIKIGDVDNGSKYITKTKQKIIKSGLQKSREVNAGDLLLTNSMSYGRPYISKIKGAIHDGWLVFYPKIDICKNYVFYFFTSFKTYENLSSLAVGSTVKNLQIKFIENLEIPLPPLDEQNKIVEKIEDCFEKIDFAILKLEKSKELIKTYKQSVLSDAFNGKLINSNSKHWQIKKLGEVFNIYRGGSPRPIKDFLTDDKDGINWIKIGDVDNGSKYITKTKQKIIKSGLQKSREVNAGDLLLTNSMSYGRPYISKIKGAIHDGWLVFYPKIDICKNYVFYFFTSFKTYENLSSLAVGSTVKNLQIKFIENLEIPLPPLDEQNKIVLEIEKRFKVADSTLSLIEENLQKAKVLKQSILQKAFNGELVKD
ncbi:restriction endonuclease subunit S, partial [Campylobacter blaseri]